MKLIRQGLPAILLGFAGAAPSPAAPPRPTLVVAISVDQLSADLFAQYRSSFRGGFARLATGVVFPSAYHAHAATETCPGHATLLTGMFPAHSGIIGNDWYDLDAPRADKRIYCVEDERAPGSSSRRYSVSLAHLRVPVLGDRMKQADPATRVYAVAGKDRGATTMGGHQADQSWWWRDGGFVSYAGRASHGVVDGVNAKLPQDIPSAALRSRVTLDEATLDVAAGFVERDGLGRGKATDLLAVSLSVTDYVGHSHGTGGPEMRDQLVALDAALGRFFERLDATGVTYAVMLSADHGGHDTPERDRERGIPEAARIAPDLNVAALNAALGGARIMGTIGSDLYFPDKTLIPAARDWLLRQPQVAAVFDAATLAATPIPKSAPPESWSLAERAAASFDPERSGDLMVLLKPHVIPLAKPPLTTHGSPWDYDRRVPLLFWWRGIDGFEQPGSILTVDIAPTIAGLIGLKVAPDAMDGRCRDLLPGPESSCP